MGRFWPLRAGGFLRCFPAAFLGPFCPFFRLLVLVLVLLLRLLLLLLMLLLLLLLLCHMSAHGVHGHGLPD